MRITRATLPLVLAATLAAMAASTGAAQPLFRWTDAEGKAHITDDPNQVPERYRPKPPPVDPRTASRAAVDALRGLGALASGEPSHEDYVRQTGEARAAVNQAVAALERGPLRTALAEAMRCYGEAAELWDNQLKVRQGFALPLNMAPIRRAWDCGAERTAEAERTLVAPRR